MGTHAARYFRVIILLLLSLLLLSVTTKIPSESIDVICIDRDDDGLCEYQQFPYDCDGDGQTWIDCVGAEDPDNACAYATDRVWLDSPDDANCAVDNAEAGGVIALEDGTYVVRCFTCSGGTEAGESCAEDADCDGGGTCTAVANACSYTFNVTYPNGETMSGQESAAALLPSARKQGIIFTAVNKGGDPNRYLDGYRSGPWILNDLGSTWASGISGKPPNGNGKAMFSMGIRPEVGANAYGIGALKDVGVADVIADFDTAQKRLCVCNAAACNTKSTASWADTNLSVGGYIYISGTYALGRHSTGTGPSYQKAQVISISPVVCGTGSNGIWVGVDGIAESMSAGSDPFAKVSVYDMRYWASNAVFEHITIAPQNPPIWATGGLERSPIECDDPPIWNGDCTAENTPHDCCTGDGTGNCSDADEYDSSCDLTSLIDMSGGFGHRVQYTVTATPASMMAGTWDGSHGIVDAVYGPKNLVGPGTGDTLIDTGTSYDIIGNTFEGCHNTDPDRTSCITTLGESVLIEYNTFKGQNYILCTGDVDDEGLPIPFVTGTACEADEYIRRYGDALISLSSNLDVMRYNTFLGIYGLVVRVKNPDALIEGNRVIGQSASCVFAVDEFADRTTIRNNQLHYVGGWDDDEATANHWSVAPICVSADGTGNTGPHGLVVTGNTVTREDEPTDTTPDPIGGLVRIQDWDSANESIVAKTWTIGGAGNENVLRGIYAPISDRGLDPQDDASWPAAHAPVPPTGMDWVNFIGDHRGKWMGSCDHDTRGADCPCAAANEGEFWIIYDLDSIDDCDDGDGTQSKSVPCYCNGTSWEYVDPWPTATN